MQKRLIIFPLQFTFPNSQYCPISRYEHICYFLIMFHVPLTLFLPILPMVDRASISAVVPMPEATVHEYSDFLLRKYKIRVAFYRVIPPPAFDSVLLKYFNQSQFGRLVLFGLDPPHNIRPLSYIKNVCHGKSPGFKFYAETWVCFRLQHNLVILVNNAGERRVPFSLVKEAMFIDVRR